MALDFDHVSKPIRKTRKLLKKIDAQPTPQQVHDFRTNCRRLESALEGLQLNSDHPAKKVLKSISRFRRRAGKIRDIDVLTGYAASVRAGDDERDCEVQLLEHLGAKRKKQGSRFHALNGKEGPSLRRHLKRLQNRLAKMESEARPQDTSHARASVSISAVEAGVELAAPARLSHNNLHPFRLKVKHLRNILKLADRPDEEFVGALGETKDAIGEWHDWLELVKVAEEILDHGRQCKLLRELKNTTEERYATALRSAQHLQKRYVGVSYRKNKGGSQFKKPTEKVLSAAEKLAA